MAIKISNKQKGVYVTGNFGGKIYKDVFRECKKCGKFTRSTSKRLTYWDKHCFNCGEEFG